MIDVPAGGTIYKMTIRNKPLELCAQPNHTMRVYVNTDPDITQLDEWEVPAGSGNRMLIGSPLPEKQDTSKKLGKKERSKMRRVR